MSREISKVPDHVYFVIEDRPSYKKVYGPYSTLGAAKGKRTTEINYGGYYSNNKPEYYTIIESPAGAWKTVEL